ncbi:MAG TPA: phosphoribosyl-AMP cyclohydrolase [Tepidisphaeraceae bacterium]|nr:phosphoribosyl-AMP cyclohydrolase [Tepidisphaeraceae bacterium]
MKDLFDTLKFDQHGLIPAIIADHASHQVLMMAWMNRDSLGKTIASGYTHFYSRSRDKLWKKGEESGHTQRVRSIRTDCDADVLLIDVEQTGVACHEGYRSCFFRRLDGVMWAIDGDREVDPAAVYQKK